MSTNVELIISKLIRSDLPFELTGDQERLLVGFDEFVHDSVSKKCLVLKGYAGTGKTTMLGSFVRCLAPLKMKCVLLAPTGRAAKVFSNSANRSAFTIHKKIYRRQVAADGNVLFVMSPNLHTNTVFIVDEASMIGDYTMTREGGVSARNLLEDLVTYVYSGINCRLILVGDEGQLPPVGADNSPALQKDYLEYHFPELQFDFYQLKTVVRQAQDSGILQNATVLRSMSEYDWPLIKVENVPDVIRLEGGELQDALESAYSNFDSDEVMLICRSNKRANLFNQQIRSRILWMEEEINGGDYMMIVKNNYYWIDEKSPAGFLANGEIMQIKRIVRKEFLYGFHFAKAIVKLVDYPEMDEFEVIINLESISTEGPNLPREQLKVLFFEIEKDYLHEKNKRKRYELITSNPYFAAIQAKFAYAVTCHKAQGGQWSAIFIDHGYLPEGADNKEFHRWLYTAMTRATEKVFLLNFDKTFFGEEAETF
jgi:exodeoxyribonuclease V